MTRPVRRPPFAVATAVAATAVALFLVALVVAAPTHPGAVPMRMVAGTASPASSESAQPTPSPTCADCVTPGDIICWEFAPYRCDVPVILSAPAQIPFTMAYRTVPMTARPQVDYVDVEHGTVVIPTGARVGYAVVYLVPDPGLTVPKQFGVAFFDPSYGHLTRPQSLVTIEPRDQ